MGKKATTFFLPHHPTLGWFPFVSQSFSPGDRAYWLVPGVSEGSTLDEGSGCKGRRAPCSRHGLPGCHRACSFLSGLVHGPDVAAAEKAIVVRGSPSKGSQSNPPSSVPRHTASKRPNQLPALSRSIVPIVAKAPCQTSAQRPPSPLGLNAMLWSPSASCEDKGHSWQVMASAYTVH